MYNNIKYYAICVVCLCVTFNFRKENNSTNYSGMTRGLCKVLTRWAEWLFILYVTCKHHFTRSKLYKHLTMFYIVYNTSDTVHANNVFYNYGTSMSSETNETPKCFSVVLRLRFSEISYYNNYPVVDFKKK